jgi:hypothetical protein
MHGFYYNQLLFLQNVIAHLSRGESLNFSNVEEVSTYVSQTFIFSRSLLRSFLLLYQLKVRTFYLSH